MSPEETTCFFFIWAGLDEKESAFNILTHYVAPLDFASTSFFLVKISMKECSYRNYENPFERQLYTVYQTINDAII